ncbi:MAG TPA: acyl-CoA thioesterase [Cyclobacteriaceae bacterium]|nr:thioesterase family protein [Cyclobacteriaceae bacterium]HMV08230.1 acyl-CoA thioesterase [Cyclobacteriaceae bacterium]HMV90995.1 acyl-CoA thioesterase [Cyclobacteriaceae bacterium]HMX02073.1 acyl-CoA thioesterase [Cyclobacteriaceae bacterium]HMX49951.1 acyl-CoA thioesterase [Cyclobacteriaceae bacterium]
MSKFSMPVSIRWADIDANRHLRHSVYYDFGAAARMQLLSERGLTTHKLEELQIGPVLFREEAVFRREIHLEDQITITVEMHKASEDYSRWSLRHTFLKQDGTLSATLTIDGAWIDLRLRKLAMPDEFIKKVFSEFPKAPDFEWTAVKK